MIKVKAKAKKNGQKSEPYEDRERKTRKRAQTRRLVLEQKTQISLI